MELTEIPFYFILFIVLYIQVFLLLAFFENPHILKAQKKQKRKRSHFPSVTIIVPCWNEEHTLARTVISLLELDYPKNKLRIFLVDDGSTDETLKIAQGFKHNPQVSVFTKANGGKHTALNYGIARTDTDLIGCLDADSYVSPSALREIVDVFDHPETQAVIPAIKIANPKSILQHIQKVEYNTGIFLRKAFALLNAVQITPGPFSIFRRRVFQELGPYRRAHNTEDMELALRLNTHGYKIENAHHAQVYTNSPKTFSALYRQRVRWTYGYVMNVFDYRRILFNRRYGNVGMIILPAGIFAMFATFYFVYLVSKGIYEMIAAKIIQIQAIGWQASFDITNFDWFSIDTGLGVFLSLFILGGTIFMVVIGKKMSENTWRPSFDMLLFILLYAYIAFSWIIKGVSNAFLARGKESWR